MHAYWCTHPQLNDAAWLKRLGKPLYFDAMPLTLAHGDYHLENLMFPAEGQNAPVVLDWQITMHATGVFDLGYFLSQSLTQEDRRTYTD